MKWVTINKLSSITGYTENAIRAKKRNGVWVMEKHWRKAPDGRILFNPASIDSWAEGN